MISIHVLTLRGKPLLKCAAASCVKSISKKDCETYDYTNKPGVIHTEILLPDHAPREYLDRSTLWNAVEKTEAAKNSQLAGAQDGLQRVR